MTALKSFFCRNRKLFIQILIAWMAGVICSAFCGATLSGKNYEEICRYISSSFSGNVPVWTVIKNGLSQNLKFTVAAALFSASSVFLPLTLLLSAFKGFATGLTSTLIIRIYTWRGVCASAVAIVIPQTLILPVYFAMLICAIRYPIERKNSIKRGIAPSRAGFISHLSELAILFVCLCVLSFAEALLSLTMGYIL
ncbi:MAG: hypothetical protein II998_08175 [Clostridia bacterium]|nr:hypothetical protein [Clostridia bacterium]